MTRNHAGRTLALVLSAALAAMCAPLHARAGGSLWGAENLIADPPVGVNDIVTVVVEAPRNAPEKDVEDDRTFEIAARVVKILPNGNLVLEARLRIGAGSLLVSGEVQSEDVGADRRVKASRLAGLAVVARDMPAGVLAKLLAADAGAAEAGRVDGKRPER